MFHPMVAGVTIPGLALFLLILAPYIDKKPFKQTRRQEVCNFTDDCSPNVLGCSRNDRFIL